MVDFVKSFLFVVGVAALAAFVGVVVAKPHSAFTLATDDDLLPGYYRNADGDIVDGHLRVYEVQHSLLVAFPYKWREQLMRDSELCSWLDAEIVKVTHVAHRIGVSGHADREAYWSEAEDKLLERFVHKVGQRYELTIVESEAETEEPWKPKTVLPEP